MENAVTPRFLLPVWLLLFFYAVLQYRVIGIPEFLTFGDAPGYWGTGALMSASGDELGLMAAMASFRGYWNCMIPWFSHAVGYRLGINPIYVYFLFPSFFIAWLTAVVFPGLYRFFSGKSADLFPFCLSLLAILYFWNGMLTVVGMDLAGAAFFLSSFLFGLRAIRERRIMLAVLAGAAGSVAVSLRTAYLYGIYACLAVALVGCLRRKRRGEAPAGELRFALLAALSALAAFLVVAVPQLLVNLRRDHLGFLPYDSEKAFLGMSEMQFHANSAFRGYMIYPTLSDAQLATMSLEVYPMYGMTWIPVEQVLTGYMYSPVETVIAILKRLFVLLDVKTSRSYPFNINRVMNYDWRGSPGILFSLLNYFVLISASCVLFSRRDTARRERAAALVFFLSLVLPMTFLLIESRFILVFYLFLYYVFAYHFCGELLRDGDAYRRLSGGAYPVLLALGTLLCLSADYSFWAWIAL